MKSYWIKERHNPQFDKPYYSACGQLSQAKARRMQQGTLYGSNVMLEYKTFYEYKKALDKFQAEGFTVHNMPRVCPECDSEILPDQTCMMGHWCGDPVETK